MALETETPLTDMNMTALEAASLAVKSNRVLVLNLPDGRQARLVPVHPGTPARFARFKTVTQSDRDTAESRER